MPVEWEAGIKFAVGVASHVVKQVIAIAFGTRGRHEPGRDKLVGIDVVSGKSDRQPLMFGPSSH
jgi:hypothetical protein